MNDTSSTTPFSPGSPLSALHQQALQQLLTQRRWAGVFAAPLASILVFLMRWALGYRLPELAAFRARFTELRKLGRPLLICPNHLTMIDSLLVMWALRSCLGYALSPSSFAWNVPAIENYGKSRILRFITYLCKCIPIDRNGSSAHLDETVEKLRTLLRLGDVCMIFPEGTRSRIGKINADAATYGVGKIAREIPQLQILCVYLRGHRQKRHSMIPAHGERFHLEMELVTPSSTARGVRALKEISMQTLTPLLAMEERFFAAHPELRPAAESNTPSIEPT